MVPPVILERAQTHREGQSNGEEGGQLALQPSHGVLSQQSFLHGQQEAQAAPRHRQEYEGRASEEGIRHSKCESKNSSKMENLHKAQFGTDFTISQQNCHKMLGKIAPLSLCSIRYSDNVDCCRFRAISMRSSSEEGCPDSPPPPLYPKQVREDLSAIQS